MLRSIYYTIIMSIAVAFYLLIIFAEIIFLGWAGLYIISLIFSWINGAPYVATSKKELDQILKSAKLKENDVFIELGCGDGRVLQKAAKDYGVTGWGIDINPILIWKANILKKIKKLDKISFTRGNVKTAGFKNADVLYIFLFPKLVNTLKNKILQDTKKGVLIIAHGFKIDFLTKMHVKTLQGRYFKTYFYRLKK